MTNVTVKCGWCKEEFDTDNSRNQKAESYGVKHCPHCGHKVRSSRIELTGNVVGKKHIHSDLKNGDVV